MLAKATLTHMRTLETLTALWNPESYTVHRVNRFAAPPGLGEGGGRVQLSTGSAERFTARLFLDSSEKQGGERDLRPWVERLECWARMEPDTQIQPAIIFLWGSFRFLGVIEELREEWLRFDPDGTPTRGWVDLRLRS